MIKSNILLAQLVCVRICKPDDVHKIESKIKGIFKKKFECYIGETEHFLGDSDKMASLMNLCMDIEDN